MKNGCLSPLGHCEIYNFTRYMDLGFSMCEVKSQADTVKPLVLLGDGRLPRTPSYVLHLPCFTHTIHFLLQ